MGLVRLVSPIQKPPITPVGRKDGSAASVEAKEVDCLNGSGLFRVG